MANYQESGKEVQGIDKLFQASDTDLTPKVKKHGRSVCRTQSDKNRLNWFWIGGKLQDS